MKGKFFFIILISLLPLIAGAQGTAAPFVMTDKDKGELFDKVKSCSGTVYEAERISGTVQKTSLVNSFSVDYDENGFGTRMVLPNQVTRYENAYDANGQLESAKTYVQGKYDGVSSYVYNPSQTIETIYDTAGNIASTVIHTKGKSVADDGDTSMTILYSSNNLMIQTITELKTDNGSQSIVMVPTYNSHSAIEKLTLTTSEGSFSIKYSDYKYDSHGNWIYRVKSQEGYGIRIEERQIEYYE